MKNRRWINTKIRSLNYQRNFHLIGIQDYFFRRINHIETEKNLLDKIIQLRIHGVRDYKFYEKKIQEILQRYRLAKPSRKIMELTAHIAKLIVWADKMDKNDYARFVQYKKRTEEYLKELDYRRLDYSQWRRLKHVCDANGFLVLGMFCREKLEKVVLNSISDAADFDYFGYLLETGDYLKAQELLNSSKYIQKWRTVRPKEIEMLDILCKRLCGGDIEGGRTLYNDRDREFAELVKGRRIVIVGRGYQEDYNRLKDEIDEGDFCVLLSYIYDGTLKSITDVLHTDLMYYDYGMFEKLKKLEDKAFIDELRYICAKEVNIGECNLKEERYNKKIRYMYPGSMNNKLVLLGGLNMIQLAIVDLLYFDCSIKAINFNLYYSVREYTDELKDCSYTDYFDRMETFYAHDTIANFRFLKSLFEKKFFEVDAEAASVLNMTEEEYVNGIEEIQFRKFLNQSGDKYAYES